MKIPKQAKQIFKGVIFDVYQWPQKMFDGNYETFEMLKRPDTVQIIATQKNKILMSRERQPHTGYFYSLFGGRVDKNEKPLAAAKRELLEESGLTTKNWKLISTEKPFNKVDWTIYTYVARDCKKINRQNLDSGEMIQVKIMSFDEFFEIVTASNFRGRDLALFLLRLEHQGKKYLNDFKKFIFNK